MWFATIIWLRSQFAPIFVQMYENDGCCSNCTQFHAIFHQREKETHKGEGEREREEL